MAAKLTILLGILLILAVACGTAEAPDPTAVPASEPTAAPAEGGTPQPTAVPQEEHNNAKSIITLAKIKQKAPLAGSRLTKIPNTARVG